MAIVESDVFDGVRNRFGTKCFRTLPSGVIVMAKLPAPPVFKKKDGKLVRDLRMTGYGECGRMTGVLSDVLRVGYVQRKSGTTPASVFMEENAATFCTVTQDDAGELVYDYDFERLLVSIGDAAKAKTTVTYDLSARTISILQEAERNPGSKRDPKDQLYACMLDTVNFESELVELRLRGEEGSKTFEVPEEWDIENTVVYTFAVFANNRKASKPNYYHHVTEAEKSALAERERLERETGVTPEVAVAVVEEDAKKKKKKTLTASQNRRAKERARSRGVQRMTIARINDDVSRIIALREEEEEKKKE